jgi:hypothetical protein
MGGMVVCGRIHISDIPAYFGGKWLGKEDAKQRTREQEIKQAAELKKIRGLTVRSKITTQ